MEGLGVFERGGVEEEFVEVLAVGASDFAGINAAAVGGAGYPGGGGDPVVGLIKVNLSACIGVQRGAGDAEGGAEFEVGELAGGVVPEEEFVGSGVVGADGSAGGCEDIGCGWVDGDAVARGEDGCCDHVLRVGK